MAAVPAFLPIQPPQTWADFHQCSARYGIDIDPADCQIAGSFLPRGVGPVTYYTRPDIVEEAYTLPWSRTVDTCTITVELGGPAAVDAVRIDLFPDTIRGMAGYVIQQCPGGGDETGDFPTGIGGYTTSGLDRMYGWLARTPDALNPAAIVGGDSGWPRSSDRFVTVTVSRPPKKSNRPGDTDVNIADRMLGFVRALYVDALNDAQRQHFWNAMHIFERKVEEMSPDREDVTWWEPSRGQQTMDYQCDKDTTGPTVKDCAKLRHHGLGIGDVEFKQGETKYFKEDTCAFAVSANKAMTLSWGQISTAFDTLVDLCVDRPFSSSKGGLATFSMNPSGIVGRKKRRAEGEDEKRTGLNALPQGSRIDIWKHGGNGADMGCELAAKLRGQPLSQCQTS